ncbi:unnamed protein product, partial [Staurois parvus]
GRTVAVQGINGLPAPCLCSLPGSAQHRDPVPAVSSGHSETMIIGRDRNWLKDLLLGLVPKTTTYLQRSSGVYASVGYVIEKY